MFAICCFTVVAFAANKNIAALWNVLSVSVLTQTIAYVIFTFLYCFMAAAASALFIEHSENAASNKFVARVKTTQEQTTILLGITH